MQTYHQTTTRALSARATAASQPVTIQTPEGDVFVVDSDTLMQQQQAEPQQAEPQPMRRSYKQPLAAAAVVEEDEPQGGGRGAAANVLTKLTLYLCIILQVVLWPSVMTITFASVLALESLFHLFIMCIDAPRAPSLVECVTDYSILFLHNRKVTTPKYIAACLVTAYMLVFFTLFVAHEVRVQPVQTMWIDSSLYGTYRPFSSPAGGDLVNNDDGAPDVTGELSKRARDPGFTWPRTLQRPAIIVNGSIPGTPINCPPGGAAGAYQCFATKLAVFETPRKEAVYVPFASSFYAADVILTPPTGTQCAALEAYRIVLDDNLNVVAPLDYPASASHTPAAVGQTPPPTNAKCGVFGVSGWCLAGQHAFTPADYTAAVGQKCVNGGGQLTIRLPPRAADYYPQSGRTGQDILVVTAGTSVQVRFLWHDLSAPTPLLNAWEETASAYNDNAQSWRDSSDSSSVFFKFVIAILPVHICWYYLIVSFRFVVQDYHNLLICLFVLLPSAITFLLVGAFLPMAGLVVCVLAMNSAPYHSSSSSNSAPGEPPLKRSSAWGAFAHHMLLFLTAVCNSIQLVWLCILIGQAGWSAFFYDVTLTQLSALSSQFIIGATGSPLWLSLVLPVVLLLNIAFLLGSVLCMIMAWMSSAASAAAVANGDATMGGGV